MGGIDVEPDDLSLGYSRGGPTIKLHLAVEQGQKPMSIMITAMTSTFTLVARHALGARKPPAT